MNEPSTDKIQQLVTAVLEAVDARLDGIRHELVQFAADADQRHHDVLATMAALERRVDELTARPTPERAGAEVATADVHRSVADLNERMAQATKILVERIEAAHQQAAQATDRKVARLEEQLEAVRAMTSTGLTQAGPSVPAPRPAGSVAAPTAVTAPPSTPSMSAPDLAPAPAPAPTPAPAPAPAMSGSFGHVTGQLPHLNDDALAEISRPLFEHAPVTGPIPRVSDSARVQQVTAPPIPPLVTPTMSPTGTPSGTPTVHTAHEDIDIARLTSLISEKLDHLSLPNRPE
jgi:hypothetical protein